MLPKKPRKYNPRLLKHDYEPVRLRLQYICDLLFGGDVRLMARESYLCPRDLQDVFAGINRATLRLLNHISVKLNVCPEWLYCGVGPIYRTDYAAGGFSPAAELNSAFCTFNTADSGAQSLLSVPIKNASVILPTITDLEPYLQAGMAMYQARAHNKLLGFFLGRNSFDADAAQQVLLFYTGGFTDILCLTLSAACFDLGSVCQFASVDLNALAKFAANRGLGYGEAIGLHASADLCTRETSVMLSVYDLGLPVTVLAEIGELAAHTAPGFSVAETGTAIGAAAYVDLLILTEQLKTFFGSPGGVFIFAGEHARGIRLVLQRIESLRIAVPQPAGFTFVVFAPADPELESLVHYHGGRVIFLNYPTMAAMTQLFQTCTDAYAGKI
jgi:hypothetical protein